MIGVPQIIPRHLHLQTRLPPPDSDVWWRVDDKRYANYYPFAEFEDQHSGSHLRLELTAFAVIKTTPKGIRVRDDMGTEFFILGNAIRQRAVPTIELALRDLIKRKERHVQGCEYRLREANEHLTAAMRCLNTMENQNARKN